MARRKRKTIIKDGIIHSYRKLSQLGKDGSYIVTIPPEWVRSHNLEAGDDLVMAANNIITIAKKF